MGKLIPFEKRPVSLGDVKPKTQPSSGGQNIITVDLTSQFEEELASTGIEVNKILAIKMHLSALRGMCQKMQLLRPVKT